MHYRNRGSQITIIEKQRKTKGILPLLKGEIIDEFCSYFPPDGRSSLCARPPSSLEGKKNKQKCSDDPCYQKSQEHFCSTLSQLLLLMICQNYPLQDVDFGIISIRLLLYYILKTFDINQDGKISFNEFN